MKVHSELSFEFNQILFMFNNPIVDHINNETLKLDAGQVYETSIKVLIW